MIPKTPNVLFTFETWMYGRPFLEFEKAFTVTFERHVTSKKYTMYLMMYDKKRS